jgi:hypothetical protein
MWFATTSELVYLQLQLWSQKTRIDSGVIPLCLWPNNPRQSRMLSNFCEPCGLLYTTLVSQQLNQAETAEQSLLWFHWIEACAQCLVHCSINQGRVTVLQLDRRITKGIFPAIDCPRVEYLPRSGFKQYGSGSVWRGEGCLNQGARVKASEWNQIFEALGLRRNSILFGCIMSSHVGVSAAEQHIGRFEQASFRTPMPRAKDPLSILRSEHSDCNRKNKPRLITRSEILLIEVMKKLMKPSNVASMCSPSSCRPARSEAPPCFPRQSLTDK